MPAGIGYGRYNPAFLQGMDLLQNGQFQNPFQGYFNQGFQNPFQMNPFAGFDFASGLDPSLGSLDGLTNVPGPVQVTPPDLDPRNAEPVKAAPEVSYRDKLNDVLRNPNSKYNKDLGRVPWGAR